MASHLPLLVVLLSSLSACAHGSSSFGLTIHHRFSDKLLHWARSVSLELPDWPKEGTPDYYSALVAHDRALLHRRGLVESNYQGLTFAAGNETVNIQAFGSLYYAEVSLGTPNVTFMVALDTGSHLMWVPCDCKSCVPTSNFKYRYNKFNSSASSTSKRVSCSSALCAVAAPTSSPESCSSPTDTCPYTVRYLDNTSTSGVLLEDVLHLITDDGQQQPVQARITFGCGQDQANYKLPTGLLGLARRGISIPSSLAAKGLTADSFSMCFGDDSSGRIRFGDKGSPDQRAVSYNSSLDIYQVTVTGVLMDGERLDVAFDAIFDTGTSFTLLAGPVYDSFTAKFDRLVKTSRISVGSNIPFSFCYKTGVNSTGDGIPNVRLAMEGGQEFNLTQPEVYLEDSYSNIVGFCLAVLRSSDVNIIGQNFMTGYKVVFDGERRVIGWKETDCYKDVELRASAPTAAAPPPRGSVFRSPSGAPAPSGTGGESAAAAPLLGRTLLPGSIVYYLFLIVLFML